MTCRTLIVSALGLLASVMAAAGSPPGPQPYLLFRVDDSYGGVIGTLSARTDFRYFLRSADASDSMIMHAKLLEKTANGFRFSWSVVQRSHGRQVAHIAEGQIVAWGTTKFLHSISGYTVDVSYSPVPANERKDFWPNHALQRTADRRENPGFDHFNTETLAPVTAVAQLGLVRRLGDPDCFGVHEFADAGGTELATEARAFHAAEWQTRIGRDHCVDENHS